MPIASADLLPPIGLSGNLILFRGLGNLLIDPDSVHTARLECAAIDDIEPKKYGSGNVRSVAFAAVSHDPSDLQHVALMAFHLLFLDRVLDRASNN